MRSPALAVLAALALPAMLPAQTHPLVGAWDLTFTAGVEMTDGVLTPITATAAFLVTAAGDSLVAVLEPPTIEGMPDLPPARFATRRTDTWPIVLEQRAEATLNLNGKTESRIAVSTWTLTVQGDTIEGTVERSIEGFAMPLGGPQPVLGIRAKE